MGRLNVVRVIVPPCPSHASWVFVIGHDVANVGKRRETFTYMAGVALVSCISSYELILAAMIDEFKIGMADEKIKQKLAVSKLLPWADDAAQAQMLYDEAIR